MVHHSVFCVCGRWFFFFKQKTEYELRISDLSSVVCSSDLAGLYRPGDPPYGPVMPVPLFETIDDLEAAPAVVAAWLAIPEVAALARARGYQEVMIGRSEERRVGKEFVVPFRCWWPPDH